MPKYEDRIYEARQQVKSVFVGDQGCKPGTFNEHIIKALIHADHKNFEKLRTVFPELAQAVEEFQEGRL